jgi:CheY-like chemotaxis protein
MPKKILIVDDEPDLMRITCFRLEKSGFNVLSAVNGKEALEVTAKEHPDLVLCDLKLPILDGLGVCMQLKKDEKLKHIPVIIFTASANDIIVKVNSCGAQDYIIKPFSAEELIEKIKKWVS